MLDILSTIPRKKRYTTSGWHSFNAICCHHRGHKADTRSRAGIKFSDANSWSYHCFNCGFKCGLQIGNSFSANLKQFLVWCGLDKNEIEKLSFESFRQRNIIDFYSNKRVTYKPEFKETSLPKDARLLDPETDELHIKYLGNRGLSPDDYTFYVVDDSPRPGIIIPFYYENKIVGNTTRYYDNRHPKYLTESQKGYVFNIDRQKADWSVCILVEGQFDAISIGGCAFMSNNISDEQAQLLRSLNRRIIFVPDRDKTGLAVCDRALELGFNISIPEWADDIKDVNDATCKYGRLPTLLSILQNATTSRIIVEMKRKKLT